ncbi:MAG: metal-dependent hydrolase [Proteobacteria bacterium]|nr:metal-dependent hydrolase [Pseudomonadota bacterium]
MDNHSKELITRKFHFKLDKVRDRYWLSGSPVKTLHANTLTTGIPFGERFFVGCLLPYIKTIKCPLLKKNAMEFARQEINHSKEHFKLYLKSVKPFYPNLKANGNFYQKISAVVAFCAGSKIRLAMVAAIEHFTAVAADLYLSHPALFEGAPKNIVALWHWHFIEEIEHKSVAFDIFKACKGNYVERVVGFFLAGFLLNIAFLNCYLHMMIYDRLYLSGSFYVESLRYFWGKEGILRHLAKPFLSYLAPNFHPNNMKEYTSHQDRANRILIIQQQLEQ